MRRRRIAIALAIGLLLFLAGCSQVVEDACPICEEEARGVYIDSETSVVNESTATVTISEDGTVHWRVENDLHLSPNEELLGPLEIERRARERIEAPQVGTEGRYNDSVQNVTVESLTRDHSVLTFTTDATTTTGPDGVVLYHGFATRYDATVLNAENITVGGPGEDVALLAETEHGEIEGGSVRFDGGYWLDSGTLVVFAPDDGLTSQISTRQALFAHHGDRVGDVAKTVAVLVFVALLGVVAIAPRARKTTRNLLASNSRSKRAAWTVGIVVTGLLWAGLLQSVLDDGWFGALAIAAMATLGTLALAARLRSWPRRWGMLLCLFAPIVPAAAVAAIVWGATDPGAGTVPSAGLLGTVLATVAIGWMAAVGAAGEVSRWHVLVAAIPPAVLVFVYWQFWWWPVLVPGGFFTYVLALPISIVYFATVGIVAYGVGHGFHDLAIEPSAGTSPGAGDSA